MGLSVICNNISKSIGTYHEVDLLKKHLIDTSIKFLRSEDEEELIEYLEQFIGNNCINYANYSFEYNNLLKLNKLEGIIIFIMKNENNNVMSVGESIDFMSSVDLIREHMDRKYFEGEKKIENFYLADVFIQSIKNNNIVEFF